MTILADRPRTAPTVLSRLDNAPTVEVSTRIATHTLTLKVLGGGREHIRWTTLDPAALNTARERFDHYRRLGYWAYTVDGQNSTVIHEFDPSADIVMHPQAQGG